MENGAKAQQEKLWTSGFIILWQGQLVSTLGDVAYSIALGFWVLSVTGSTALMGTLMAVSTLPGVLASPFAGVLIDRQDRKKLLIWADFIRGAAIVLIAAAAYVGILAVWMVFAAGVVLSVCGAAFRPGVNSAIPDLVPKSRLTSANSAFSVVTTGSNMLGNFMGGYLFLILGAPALFLINGLSFLFSGISIFFVRIPKVMRTDSRHFFRDLKDGFSFAWKLKGLRYVILFAAFINFFFNIAFILLLPLFQKSPELGAGSYGLIMAFFMGGAMAGFLLLSVLKIPPVRKFPLFILSCVIFSACLLLFANTGLLPLMAVLAFSGGLFNSVVNVFLMTSVQLATPTEVRGKVLSFMVMVTQSLAPFAMALGGVLGGVFPIRSVMTACFALMLAVSVPFAFNGPVKRFINFDFEH
jgi:DHA3 family macrolide efflux protein-like MFS transporter